MFLGTLTVNAIAKVKTPPHCSLYDTRSFNYRNQLHCGLSTGNPATASSKCKFRCLLEISRLISSLVSDDSRKGFVVCFCFFHFCTVTVIMWYLLKQCTCICSVFYVYVQCTCSALYEYTLLFKLFYNFIYNM